MSSQFQPGSMVYTQSMGSRAESVEVPVIQNRAPATTDVQFPVGKNWIDSTNNAAYVLTSLSTFSGITTGNWQQTAAESGAVASVLGTANQITVTTASNVATVSLPAAITAPGSLATTTSLTAGNGFTVTAGTTSITGTVGVNTSGAGVTTIGTGGTGATNIGNASGNTAVTGSLGTTTSLTAGNGFTVTTGTTSVTGTVGINVSGAGVTTIGTGGTGATNIGNATGNTAVTGSLIASTTLTATSGNITATVGDFVATNGGLQLQTVGNKISIKAGATGFVGTGTLASGTVTINNTNIATGDLIFLTRIAANGSTTFGVFSYTISNGASFTVTSLILGTPGSTQTADTSTFAYFIVRPL